MARADRPTGTKHAARPFTIHTSRRFLISVITVCNRAEISWRRYSVISSKMHGTSRFFICNVYGYSNASVTARKHAGAPAEPITGSCRLHSEALNTALQDLHS